MFIVLFASLSFAEDTCPAGTLVTQDSLGHCCWEGQAWNGAVCAGLPLACPAGSRVEIWSQSCISNACEAGMLNVDTLHCCWPDQSWDSVGETCVGRAQCPVGFQPQGDSYCLPEGTLGGLIGVAAPPRPAIDPARVGSCPSGQQLAADELHCCLPGDAWSSVRGVCVSPSNANLRQTTSSNKGSFGTSGPGSTSVGEPVILGALDRSLIDEVIRRNMAQIRYCYQRELTKSPALEGKLVVKFVIAPDGTVSSATTKTSTLNNPAVEQCVNGRFMKMQFPEPKGGGVVIVSYPLVFTSG